MKNNKKINFLFFLAFLKSFTSDYDYNIGDYFSRPVETIAENVTPIVAQNAINNSYDFSKILNPIKNAFNTGSSKIVSGFKIGSEKISSSLENLKNSEFFQKNKKILAGLTLAGLGSYLTYRLYNRKKKILEKDDTFDLNKENVINDKEDVILIENHFTAEKIQILKKTVEVIYKILNENDLDDELELKNKLIQRAEIIDSFAEGDIIKNINPSNELKLYEAFSKLIEFQKYRSLYLELNLPKVNLDKIHLPNIKTLNYYIHYAKNNKDSDLEIGDNFKYFENADYKNTLDETIKKVNYCIRLIKDKIEDNITEKDKLIEILKTNFELLSKEKINELRKYPELNKFFKQKDLFLEFNSNFEKYLNMSEKEFFNISNFLKKKDFIGNINTEYVKAILNNEFILNYRKENNISEINDIYQNYTSDYSKLTSILKQIIDISSDDINKSKIDTKKMFSIIYNFNNFFSMYLDENIFDKISEENAFYSALKCFFLDFGDLKMQEIFEIFISKSKTFILMQKINDSIYNVFSDRKMIYFGNSPYKFKYKYDLLIELLKKNKTLLEDVNSKKNIYIYEDEDIKNNAFNNTSKNTNEFYNIENENFKRNFEDFSDHYENYIEGHNAKDYTIKEINKKVLFDFSYENLDKKNKKNIDKFLKDNNLNLNLNEKLNLSNIFITAVENYKFDNENKELKKILDWLGDLIRNNNVDIYKIYKEEDFISRTNYNFNYENLEQEVKDKLDELNLIQKAKAINLKEFNLYKIIYDELKIIENENDLKDPLAHLF